LRAASQRLDARRCAVDHTPFNVDAAPLGIALHDLGDAEVAPRAQPGTPVGSCPDRIATGLAHGTNN